LCPQILICQNLRNNLQHPNEYLRGSTLRFLCRIHEEEILEPLVPSILANLEHRHSFVRRNAVLAISALYRLPKGEVMLQDAPELIEKVLQTEQDLSTKRNAFQFLCNHALDRAVAYLLGQVDNVALWGDILQMAVLELIRKVRRSPPCRFRVLYVLLCHCLSLPGTALGPRTLTATVQLLEL
jgi:coatomer subunit beta